MSLRAARRRIERWAGGLGWPRPYYLLAPDMALTRLRDGHWLYVDPLDESVCHRLVARGDWEPWGHRIVRRLVRPGDAALDVGAHVGTYALTLARAVGPKGSVTAVEANPRLAGLLERSLRLNGHGQARLARAAASDRAGEATFGAARRFAGGGQLGLDGFAIAPDREVFTVPTARLDDLVEGTVRLIRMDIEGAEPLALLGAPRLLARPDVALFMEWDPIQMAPRRDPADFAAWLADQGFGFERVTRRSGLVPVAAADLAALPPGDLVIRRPGQA